MTSPQVRRAALMVLVATAAGALGGYLAGLVRPRPPTAYSSHYLAPPTPHRLAPRDQP